MYLDNNGYVRQGLTWEGIRWALWDDYFGYPHPLTWISLMANTSLLGDSPGSYRIVNILLHCLNTLLVFGLTLRMVPARLPVAVFVAAVFAWHPTRVESVIWISERKDVLSAFFFLVTLHGYMSYACRRRCVSRYLTLVTVPFLLALLSKPSVVIIPPLLLLLDIWPLRRLLPNTAGRFRTTDLPALFLGVLKLLPDKLPLFALSFLWGVWTLSVAQGQGVNVGWDEFTFLERITNLPLVYATYLLQFLFPQNLTLFHPHDFDYPHPISAAAAGLVLTLLFIRALASLWSNRGVFVSWFWFFGILLPISGLLQNGNQFTANRYTYIPYVGLALFAALAMDALRHKVAVLMRPLGFSAMVWILLLPPLTLFEQTKWRSNIDLWQSAVLSHRGNSVAFANLAAALHAEGRVREARAKAVVAVALDPSNKRARLLLAHSSVYRGEFAEAVAQFNLLHPVMMEWVKGKTTQGYSSREVIVEARESADLFLVRAMAEYGVGNMENAVRCFRIAKDLDHPSAYRMEALPLGRAIGKVQGKDSELAFYEEMIRQDPGFPLPYHRAALSISLTSDIVNRDFEKALDFSSQALLRAPKNPTVLLGHAIILAGARGMISAEDFLNNAAESLPKEAAEQLRTEWDQFCQHPNHLIRQLLD